MSYIPHITKYEFAALISERAEEIANNNPITVKNPGTINPLEIAMLEYKQGKSPKKICRIWPDGTKEVYSLSKLTII